MKTLKFDTENDSIGDGLYIPESFHDRVKSLFENGASHEGFTGVLELMEFFVTEIKPKNEQELFFLGYIVGQYMKWFTDKKKGTYKFFGKTLKISLE